MTETQYVVTYTNCRQWELMKSVGMLWWVVNALHISVEGIVMIAIIQKLLNFCCVVLFSLFFRGGMLLLVLAEWFAVTLSDLKYP